MSEVKFEKYSITLSTEMKMPAIEIRNFSINVAEKSLAERLSMIKNPELKDELQNVVRLLEFGKNYGAKLETMYNISYRIYIVLSFETMKSMLDYKENVKDIL